MKIVSHNTYTRKNSFLRKVSLLLLLGIFMSSSFIIFNTNNTVELGIDSNDISQQPTLSDPDTVLFEGNEISLNITDYGNLYETEQQIDVTNQEAVNLTYYLDDVHDWEVSEVETHINNIQETKNWVEDIDFSHMNLTKNTVVQVYESNHDYLDNRNKANSLQTITETGAIAIRVHIDTIEVESSYDVFYIEDENDSVIYQENEFVYDFFSPWARGDTLQIYLETDSATTEYGYYIDYYEYVTGNSSILPWGDYSDAVSETYYGYGFADNSSAMFTELIGTIDPSDTYWVDYSDDEKVQIYQDLSVPRGWVLDASFSFDYFAQEAIATNDFSIFAAINGHKIYSLGFADVVDLGRNTWHSTGDINMDLWVNSSVIFDKILYGNNINFSVGIKSGGGASYGGYDDRYQQVVWFSNISFVLTTMANSTQSGINLQVNNNILNDDDVWGVSYLNLTGNWNINPLKLTVSTDSPSLSFDLDTTLYGHHETKSRIGQTILEGVSYKILENGTIIWEFSHNFYMPSQYSDFEFTIFKPRNWNFISVLDPTLQSRPYEYGGEGDSLLHITKENALFPGWWTFKASSPNYLSLTNTELSSQGPFKTGESTSIKTQINNTNEIPIDVDLTLVNLTIYDSDGLQWYTESKTPLSDGTVEFSELRFGALNTTGGQFDYTLFWSNGTALGGVKSNFIVNHNSQLRLLKPDDAKIDLRTDGFVGDIIPVRVILTDVENNLSITNAVVSYNWTGGSTYNFTEAAIGIYEAILDTTDLASRGLYEILISSSKLGFIESNLTLEINLGEETGLQRLESEYNIELHANSTIKFKFTDFSGDGIDGATVNVSISNPSHYSIDNLGNGIYDIEFSTSYISNIGIYHLNFSFSATGYEPQYYVYQYQVIEQSVNLSVYINTVNIQENSLHEYTFFEPINVSARAMSIIDEVYISGGNFTWISASYEKNLTELANYWYNSSIEFLPVRFSSGINFIYLRFEHPNYRTQTFGFEILIDRIEFEVDIVGHEDSNPTIKAEIGGSLSVEIELIDFETSQPIENATVLYEWTYGVGELEEISPGNYQLSISLPENLDGNFIFNLIISKEGTIYKTTQSSFLLVIGEPQLPTFLIWIIIIVSALIISTLGIMSLRSYVILPRRRRREADLLTRTQRFKDMQNIQAIVAIHKDSGIPLYTKSYSILEKHKKEIFSGFIQAIITVGEEMVGKKGKDRDFTQLDGEDGTRTILELDFKYFYCLICDRQDLRIIFILTEKASDRLKTQISDLSLGAMLELSEQIGNWDGAIHEFEVGFPPIINKYLELSYKEGFTINNAQFISKIRKESELNSMETRILNVIYSIAKSKSEFHLGTIFENIHEKNQNIVIDGIETLIKKQIIIPSTK